MFGANLGDVALVFTSFLLASPTNAFNELEAGLPHGGRGSRHGDGRWCSEKCLDWRGVLGFFAFSSNKNVLEDTGLNKHLPSNHAFWHEQFVTPYQLLSAIPRDV